MSQLIDMSGKRVERLKVISRSTRTGRTYWYCECDCGKLIEVVGNNLRNGNTKSCGCRRAELGKAQFMTHGGTGTPTHKSWLQMRRRCYQPTDEHYEDYGGRGITICERWMNFENFLADMGERPPGTSIDRYPNNDGDYEPGNCRWATPKQQRANRRDSRP